MAYFKLLNKYYLLRAQSIRKYIINTAFLLNIFNNFFDENQTIVSHNAVNIPLSSPLALSDDLMCDFTTSSKQMGDCSSDIDLGRISVTTEQLNSTPQISARPRTLKFSGKLTINNQVLARPQVVKSLPCPTIVDFLIFVPTIEKRQYLNYTCTIDANILFNVVPQVEYHLPATFGNFTFEALNSVTLASNTVSNNSSTFLQVPTNVMSEFSTTIIDWTEQLRVLMSTNLLIPFFENYSIYNTRLAKLSDYSNSTLTVLDAYEYQKLAFVKII